MERGRRVFGICIINDHFCRGRILEDSSNHQGVDSERCQVHDYNIELLASEKYKERKFCVKGVARLGIAC